MTSPPLVGLPTDRKQIGPHPFLAVGEKYVRAVVEGAEAIADPAAHPATVAAAATICLNGSMGSC